MSDQLNANPASGKNRRQKDRRRYSQSFLVTPAVFAAGSLRHASGMPTPGPFSYTFSGTTNGLR